MGGPADEGAAECTKRVEALAQAWHTSSKGQDYWKLCTRTYVVFFYT